MQLKTIKRILTDKMEDWFSTIDDVKLVIDLRKSIIVTGGSIASLFLNEKVNDYDVYINNINVLERLIKYYIYDKGIELLDGRDKIKLLNQIEDEYAKVNIDSINNITSARLIAIRTLKEDQLKLYFNSEAGIRYDLKEDLKYQVAYLSPNAISLSDDLQIITRFTGDADKIHENYDFVHATNYFTFSKGVVTNIKALESLLTKQLYYKGSLYPVTSIIRLKKFIKRGYNISAGEIFKIIYQCSALDLNNPDVLEEQLIGVDIAYFAEFILALRNIENGKIDNTYINTIINRIFND